MIFPSLGTGNRSAMTIARLLSQAGRVKTLAFRRRLQRTRLGIKVGGYRRGAHTVFEIHLHLVWITKYRRAALKGEVASRTRDLIRDICAQHEVRIMKGHVSKDHIHLFRIDTAASDDRAREEAVFGDGT